MKKSILAVALMTAAFGLQAKDYVIFQDAALTEDQVQVPTSLYTWEGTVTATDQDGASVWAINGDAWFGGGWNIAANTFDVSVFNNTAVNLVFEYKTDFTGAFKLQFKNETKNVAKEDVAGTLTADNEWHSFSLDVVSFAPEFLKSLENGNAAYIFAPVGGNGGQGKTIAFRNVKFEVTGEPYTPPVIEPGSTWYGSGSATFSNNGKDCQLDVNYNLVANSDNTLTVNTTIEGLDEFESINPKFHFTDQENNWPIMTKQADGTYSATSTVTYTLGNSLANLFFYIEYPGGVQRIDITGYTFGAANEKPVTEIVPKVTASAENVTATTADLVYSVTLPEELEGAAVVVYVNDKVAAESPVKLTDLTQKTAYTYEVKAVATLNDQTYESKVVKVNFTTPRDGATAAVYHAIVDGYLPNAYLAGEDAATMRRDIPVSIEATATYEPDGTITVEGVPHVGNVVGFVLKCKVACIGHDTGVIDMTNENGKWTANTKVKDITYDEGVELPWFLFYPVYDGGACEIYIRDYKTGDVNDPVAYGDPARIGFNLTSNEMVQGETVSFGSLAMVYDANNHFLLDETIEYTSSNEDVLVVRNEKEWNDIYAYNLGKATITAAAGDITASEDIHVFVLNAANQLDNSIVKSAVHNGEEADVAVIFDGNEGTQIEWSCAETENHTLEIKLNEPKWIHAIQLVWEGASATEYTVEVGNAPVNSADAANKEEDKIFYEPAAGVTYHKFEVTDGEGGAGVTARKTLVRDDYANINADKITLTTSKAFNKDWGMKLKEMKVYATAENLTAVETIEAPEAEVVDVYSISGVRVRTAVNAADALRDLPAGLYIAGGKKVVVK